VPKGEGSQPLSLKDGDIAEVGLEGVGMCVNKTEYIYSRRKSSLIKFESTHLALCRIVDFIDKFSVPTSSATKANS